MRPCPPVRPTRLHLLVLALLLLAPGIGTAHAADYTVRLSSTAGAHWYLHGQGPFLHDGVRLYSGKGTFKAGDYKSWRAVVPGEGAQVVGGKVRIAMSTPGSTMRARVLAGTGSTSRTIYDDGVEGAVEQGIAGGPFDWVQFDLRSTGAAQTTAVGQNFVNLQYMELLLRDSVPPSLAPISLPAPGTWHGAGGCIPFSIRLTDQGGGLLRSQVRRATDGVVVSELGTTQVESPRPGPIEQHLADCIHPHERWHGDTTFVATAWDVSGVARELAFTLRADHAAPTITAGPADGARFTIAKPAVAFQVGDQGAGVASVVATLDGTAVPVHVSGSFASVQVGTVPIGDHVVAIAVTDGAGNASRVERRFSVADTEAPQLVLDAPGGSGEATAWLSVRASDDMSGVDPSRWVATVNGESVPIDADAARLTATLGPLAPGSHRIEVRVADRAGNAAAIGHTYAVTSASVPSMPDVGARTGAFLVERPPATVGYGLPASVGVFVSRNGRPMSGQLVEVRREGTVFGSATTDEHGIARVGFRAGAPGGYQAWVAGLSMDPADIPIQVAPRLIIRTNVARPRVGQRVWVTGRIVPALRGRKVAVQARIGGTWYSIRRSATSSASGTFRTWVVPTARGIVWTRVRAYAVDGWSPAVSNQRRLVVKPAPRRQARRPARAPARR